MGPLIDLAGIFAVVGVIDLALSRYVRREPFRTTGLGMLVAAGITFVVNFFVQ